MLKTRYLLFMFLAFTLNPLFAQTASSDSMPSGSPSASPHKHAARPLADITPAPGGGPGIVWVNVKTHIYHKFGSRYYGKTMHGKYMSEADAQKEGDHPAKASQ